MGYHDNKKIIEACLKCAALCNHCASASSKQAAAQLLRLA